MCRWDPTDQVIDHQVGWKWSPEHTVRLIREINEARAKWQAHFYLVNPTAAKDPPDIIRPMGV
jgi:hypothetical protein